MLIFKSTHELLMRIEAMKLNNVESKLGDTRQKLFLAENALHNASNVVEQQQKTIDRLTSELILLRGAVRTEKSEEKEGIDYLLQPDIQVSATGPIDADRILREARAQMSKSLAALKEDDLDGADRSTEQAALLAAAIPTSINEWKDQHRAPADDDNDAA
jgi:hypothetical protein